MIQDKDIHVGVDEATVGVIGRADDGFTPHIEGGVHKHGAARNGLEPLEQLVQARVLVGGDRLDAG